MVVPSVPSRATAKLGLEQTDRPTEMTNTGLRPTDLTSQDFVAMNLGAGGPQAGTDGAVLCSCGSTSDIPLF